MSDCPCIGVDEGESDFIATMFGTIADQRSPCMVFIIVVKGTLFLYHLLAWKSCTLSRTRCQCLKWKLTRRIHNLLEFAFDLGWPIMTGPRRDYGISHRTSTPQYQMVSLAMLYNNPDYFLSWSWKASAANGKPIRTYQLPSRTRFQVMGLSLRKHRICRARWPKQCEL